MRDTQSISLMWEVKPIVESNSNGSREHPEIKVSFEPVDDQTGTVQDRWVRKNEETGEYEISFGDEVRNQLGIEEDDEDEDIKSD